MATLMVRNIDTRVKDQLRLRAARNRRSLEAELRAILTQAAAVETRQENLAEAIHRRFAAVGEIEDLPPHPPVPIGEPPGFEP